MRLIKTIAILGALFGASSFANTADASPKCMSAIVFTLDGVEHKYVAYGEHSAVRSAIDAAGRRTYGFQFSSVSGLSDASTCSDNCCPNQNAIDIGNAQ